MLPRSPLKDLRRLEWADILPERPLAGHIRDRWGRVLNRRGHILTYEALRRLQFQEPAGVYAGEDWPATTTSDAGAPPITPEELLQATQRRTRSLPRSGRGRRHARHSWTAQLHMIIQETSGNVIQRRQLSANACDLSAAGFAFLCPHFVHPGTVVYVHFNALPNRPLMKGVVRNSVHLEGRCHRVGVEFVKPDPGELLPNL